MGEIKVRVVNNDSGAVARDVLFERGGDLSILVETAGRLYEITPGRDGELQVTTPTGNLALVPQGGSKRVDIVSTTNRVKRLTKKSPRDE